MYAKLKYHIKLLTNLIRCAHNIKKYLAMSDSSPIFADVGAKYNHYSTDGPSSLFDANGSSIQKIHRNFN